MPKKDKPRKDKLDEFRVAARRDRVARLYHGGVESTLKIAERLGISQQTAATDLRAVLAELRAAAPEALAEARARQIAEIRMIRAEAFDEWEKSRRPGVVRTHHRELRPAPRGGKRKGQYPNDQHTAAGTVRREAAKIGAGTKGVDALMVEVGIRVEEREVGRTGDPKFLQIMLACNKELSRLQGLVDGPGEAGRTVNNVNNVNYVQVRLEDWYGPPARRPSDAIEETIERAALPPAGVE